MTFQKDTSLNKYQVSPLEVLLVNRAITNRTFAPGLFTQGEIVKDTCPTKDMPTAGDLCCGWWVQTYWARGHFMATNSLKWHMRRMVQVLDLEISSCATEQATL